jgi:sugar/nucleoside kinase (ribokinase family)
MRPVLSMLSTQRRERFPRSAGTCGAAPLAACARCVTAGGAMERICCAAMAAVAASTHTASDRSSRPSPKKDGSAMSV